MVIKVQCSLIGLVIISYFIIKANMMLMTILMTVLILVMTIFILVMTIQKV
jgi:hypothetical protein